VRFISKRTVSCYGNTHMSFKSMTHTQSNHNQVQFQNFKFKFKFSCSLRACDTEDNKSNKLSMTVYVSHDDDAEYGTLKLTRASTATTAVLADFTSPPKPLRRVTYGGNELSMHLPARRPSFMRRLVRNLEEVSTVFYFNAIAIDQ
jgi:hypothetical protein